MKRGLNGASLAWTITLAFTAVIAVTYAFGVYLFPSLMPDMRRSLGFSYAEAGTIAALRQIAFLVTALASATAVVRFGAGRVILGSTLMCGAALCGLGMAGSTVVAAGLLIMLNACAASAWIPMVSIVAKVVGYQHQGKAVGLIASGTNYGLCLNGLLVPALLGAFGWRSVWVVAGGVTLLLSGLLWLTLGQASLFSGDTRGSIRQATPWRLAIQTRYLVMYGLAFLAGLAGVPVANYLSAYIRDDLHLSVAVAGQAWLATGLAGAVGGVLFGAIGDRAGLRVSLAGATALFSTSVVLIATGTSAVLLVFAAGCFGASFFSIFGILPTYVGKTTEAGLTPAICGLVECSLGMGGALGSFLGGFGPQAFGSLRAVYIAAGAISATMICLTSLLPREGDGPNAISLQPAPE